MPAEMLREKAAELRAIADALEAYADEGGEENSETEPGPMADSSSSESDYGGGSSKIKMAAARIGARLGK